MKPDEQLDKPYEEWAQRKTDKRALWKQRLNMAAIGAGVGLLIGAAIHGFVVVTRPDMPAGISWSGVGFVFFGGALCGLIEGWKG